ncbi:type I methionyl aminopeptidase [Candidatus Peregrinibacteria bacterium]|nr:type I methionyl aminopeptidase [Candidatus Peregrinibacteria bacterium]
MTPIYIKTPEEIVLMRESGRILQKVLNATCARAKMGVTTRELDIFAESMIRDLGGEPSFKGYHGYPAALCTSVNEQVVHAIPSDYALKSGDIVGIDAGVYYRGFHTDACKTVIIGSAPPEVRFFVRVTKEALDQAIKQIKAGVAVGDISAAIQRVLERQGYSPVIECTGHGVGRQLHEEPDICNAGQRGTGPQLRAGMTIAIEPISAMGSGGIETLSDGWTIITRDRSLSAHFEHTVLVTETGAEILA